MHLLLGHLGLRRRSVKTPPTYGGGRPAAVFHTYLSWVHCDGAQRGHSAICCGPLHAPGALRAPSVRPSMTPSQRTDGRTGERPPRQAKDTPEKRWEEGRQKKRGPLH